MDGRTWLRHAETGGTFHCPDAAVEDWQERGWQPGEAPDETNPAVVEHLAWRAEQAARQETIKKSAATPAPTEEK